MHHKLPTGKSADHVFVPLHDDRRRASERGRASDASAVAARRAMLRSMSTPAHRIHYTWTEYLALEASSNVKHEYLDGQIYAMAGGTPEHAALAAAVIGLLFPQLREGRCRLYDSDLRVRVRATGLATYPDVTVVCGPRERDPEDEQAVTNPTLIVEVLSRGTEEYDRGDKLEHYKQLPSLREYVLVSHRERSLEVWRRDAGGAWTASVVERGVAELESIAARLDVRELYDAAAQPAR
jgi:Uma2 family endonuclease